MKILSIAFENINSLKGTHEIDFESEAFKQSPLFAITGPTGSGKTTLLDVISLALFGQIPRMGKIYTADVADKGAVLTRNQKEAFAKVTYEGKQGKFASLWNISTNRNGNLREYDMELYQLEPYERLDLKKSEVPDKNEELIGLNYDQFIKSVILAQGEFAKFLKSDRKERSNLLESITGTGIYRQLGRLAFERYREIENTIKDQKLLLHNEESQLLPEKDRMERGEELLKLNKESKESEKTEEALRKEIEIKQEILDLDKTILNRQKQLEEEGKQKEEYEKDFGVRLEKHKEVARFSETLNEWKNRSGLLKNLLEEEEQFFKQKSTTEKDREGLLAQIKSFVKEEFSPDQTQNRLKGFLEKVSKLQEELAEVKSEYTSHSASLEAEVKKFGLTATSIIENPSKWEGLQNSMAGEIDRLRNYFKAGFPEHVEKHLEAKENELDQKRNAKIDALEMMGVKKEFEKYKFDLKEVEAKLEPLPKQIQELENQEKHHSKDLEIAKLSHQNWILETELENHRHHLVDGQPCPLCGATEHPYKDDKPEVSDKWSEKIKQLERGKEKILRNLSKLQERIQELTSQKTKLDQLVKAKNSEAKDLFKLYEQNYGEGSFMKPEQIEIQIQSIQKEIKALKELKEVLQKSEGIKEVTPVYDHLKKVTQKGQVLKDQINKLYNGNNLFEDYSRFDKGWQKVLQDLDHLKTQINHLGTKKDSENSALKTLENQLLPELQKIGFSEITAAFSVLLPVEETEKIRQQIQKFKDEINRISTEIKMFSERKNNLTEQLQTEEELEVLKNKKESLRQEQEERKKKIQSVGRLLQNDDDRRKTIKHLKEEIDKKTKNNKPWERLNQMIGDAMGNKFNQFAQDLTLRHLLKLANKRLKGINKRYELVMIPNQDKNKDNLAVADLDMGGQRRAVHTLSGGETFLMSLGLALALSDLAAQNIQINSLFIDEGFGTLDPDTLDQTLDTLERLQASSSKTIGIISHVDSLKERIATQIQLEKGGQGYSNLKIVSN